MRLRLHALRIRLVDVFGGLPRRAWLTLRHRGLRSFLFRAVTFPLRLTPLGSRLGLGTGRTHAAAARRWYEESWRPVTVAIPHYGPPEQVVETVKSVRRTTDPRRVRVVVADDASPEPHRGRLLEELEGRAEVVLGEENAGFAVNANRALRAAPDGDDLVLLNSDVVALPGWIEALQQAAYGADDVGIVGPKLLYPDRTIQSAGSYRNLGAPEWFDHRHRFKPPDHGPANVVVPVVATTGACMYARRDCVDRIGLLDERYPMAYEDVDWCLRAWEAGMRVMYQPQSALFHLESKTRGTDQGERELESQRLFWETWGDWFDARDVRTPEGRLRVVYVTEDTGVGGGHRVVFEHLNGLAERGHECALYTLDRAPEWFDLRVPVRTFDDYDELTAALAEVDALKVATWWNTAAPVWNASVRRGIPVYFVQDIETSYYPHHPHVHPHVYATYREEFRYMTTSQWVADRLRELNLDPAIVPPGVDLDTFHDLGREREEGVLLSVGRSLPLKNLDLTIDAWSEIPNGRPQLWLFGIEPELGERFGARYFTRPSDAEVNELLNTATALVQTSRHEGFCLPLLEGMAAGVPVVCTDAHGNRDFCRDGENCLMAEPSPDAVRSALVRLLEDADLRARLADEGKRTAARYAWPARIDELERLLESLAPRPR
ncbi:MAG TPA: glycosyltransferase [Thermoleophilaceae bacterium]|jgi:GT2 family glycosyltransferase/glycosyltransferase involved in cell wall biosynthesis